MEGQGTYDHSAYGQASGNTTSQGTWKEATFTEHLQCVRQLHAEDLVFSHFTHIITLPGKQAQQGMM